MFNFKSARTIASIFTGCLIVGAALTPVFAQSIDRNNPTPLTTNSIAGKGLHERDQVFYYRFTAKPGKIAIDLDIDPGNDPTLNSDKIGVRVQTLDGEDIATDSDFAAIPIPSHDAKRLNLETETPVILVLKISRGESADYNYRIKIDGDWVELTK
jgi:hypothetical protein